MTADGTEVFDYESKFGNWENRSSVRNKPRRVLDHVGKPLLFFPSELVPAVHHPLVVDRGPEVLDQMLVRSLYQYLHFTTVLEQVAVLPVTARLSLNRAGVDIPEGMRSDAFKITTDEAWHAQFSHDFINEVAAVTRISSGSVVEPVFARRLDRMRADFEPSEQHLVDLVFAVVSETLVSSLLSDIPNDRRLPKPVRELVADHAADEGRHNAYFRSFLRVLWPALSERERWAIGPRIPELVSIFLYPDLDAVQLALTESGFSNDEAKLVVADTYTPDSAVYDIRQAARSTVRSFGEVGALDDPATLDAFVVAGFREGLA